MDMFSEKAEAATSANSNETAPNTKSAQPQGSSTKDNAQAFFCDAVIEPEEGAELLDEALDACIKELGNSEDGPNLRTVALLALELDEDRLARLMTYAKGARCKTDLLKEIAAVRIEKRREATEERGLLAGKDGSPIQNFENVRRILLSENEGWHEIFAFNEFDACVWVAKAYPGARDDQYPRKFEDTDTLIVTSWLQSNGFESIWSNIVFDAISAAAQEKRFHPVREYLEGLEWDGVQRIHSLFCTYIECEVNHEIPGYEEYLKLAGQRFCIGAVRRIMEPGCKLDHMPTISGPQGKFKSSAFAALCGEQWFGDDMPAVDNKDAKDWLRGKWFGEVAEMASMTNKDVDKVKSFMSTRRDSYRKAYGRTTEDQLRQSILCGTVNDDEYLVDVTGGRRFWPMRVTEASTIYVEAITADRDQLWAEAVHMWREGAKHWFDVRECPALEAAQENARSVEIGEEQVRDWLSRQPQGAEVTAPQVAAAVFPHESTNRTLSMRVARYLKSCHWEQSRKTAQVRYWTRTARAIPAAPSKPDLRTV